MKIREIANVLDAKILSGDDLLDSVEVLTACGADMMSDVLAFAKERGILITGLCNPQVIRTAEMMDIVCVAFVRGKTPDALSVSLAQEKGIIVLTTTMRMYQACGKLYAAGLDNV